MRKSEIAKLFSNGDFEDCFEYLTENATWNTPGEHYLRGKTEIENFCKKIRSYFDSITTNFQQINIIENENCVAINGTAEFVRDGIKLNFISSCDVYEFNSENRIISITSYCIPESREN